MIFPSHRILATAIWTRDNNPDRFVALVTKDINLRMKAKAAGMEVQDYLTDRIDEDKIENSNKEVQFLGGLSPEALQALPTPGDRRGLEGRLQSQAQGQPALQDQGAGQHDLREVR